jgi:flagellar biosynthesis anti-sigma factor FlgM
MKIEHTLDRLAKLKEQNKVKEANAAKLNKIKNRLQEQNKTQNNPSAKVEISAKAKELGAIKKIAKAESSDNSEKIARLKNLIAERKYEVPAEKIADKMVDEHLKNESV